MLSPVCPLKLSLYADIERESFGTSGLLKASACHLCPENGKCVSYGYIYTRYFSLVLQLSNLDNLFLAFSCFFFFPLSLCRSTVKEDVSLILFVFDVSVLSFFLRKPRC